MRTPILELPDDAGAFHDRRRGDDEGRRVPIRLVQVDGGSRRGRALGGQHRHNLQLAVGDVLQGGRRGRGGGAVDESKDGGVEAVERAAEDERESGEPGGGVGEDQLGEARVVGIGSGRRGGGGGDVLIVVVVLLVVVVVVGGGFEGGLRVSLALLPFESRICNIYREMIRER